MKQRILLLHISECGGHKSASRSIEEAIRVLAPHMEVHNINGFGYIYPSMEKYVDYLYTTTIKHAPQLWGTLYDRKPVIRISFPFKKLLNRMGFRRFSQLISKVKPDAIVATQAFPCGLAADFKKFSGARFPIFAVVTDYYPHRFWIHPYISSYIVACDDAKDILVREGVEEEKVKIFGIPTSLKFMEVHPRREIARRFGFNVDSPTVLIMGGGSGYGPIQKIAVKLNRIRADFQVIVVCGRNRKLYDWFKRKSHRFKKPTFYFEYVNFVHQLMDFSDIIITKAGGITISEALVKHMAIIVTNPIPGQEERNVSYLEKKGAVLRADDPERINYFVERLINNRQELERLKAAASSYAFKDSSLRIAEFILNFYS